MDSKVKFFDGSGDVRVFVENLSIQSSLKGYDGEKAAQNLASKLEGRAFDIYLRLSSDDRKNPDKIKSELFKEFEEGKQDREEAIFQLGNRTRHPDESVQTFAHKITELVRLAHPSFDETTTNTIAIDYYVRGLHQKMQIALKALPSFAEADINTLAMEATPLQVAGIETFSSNTVDKAKECMAIASTEGMDDTIADKVIEKLRNIPFHTSTDKDWGNESANFVGYQMRGGKGRGRGSFRNRIHQQRGAIQEIPGVFNQKESAGPVKVQTTFISTAPFVFAKPAITKATIHGIRRAPSTND